MKYLEIRNWHKFQHYKDRTPPWIKLHYELITSHDWVMLSDESKLLMVVCMMIGSRNDGKVPIEPSYLKKVAHLSKLPDFKPLIECGFFGDASVVLANASTKEQANAIIEERRGEEEKREVLLPDWMPQEEWSEFKKMRQSIRAPMTAHAQKLIVSKLAHLRASGNDPKLVLEASIQASWKGVFPLSDGGKPQAKTGFGRAGL